MRYLLELAFVNIYPPHFKVNLWDSCLSNSLNSWHYCELYHEVNEMLNLSQPEALNLVTWRVKVMQPTTSSPWRRGHRWPNYESSLMLGKWVFETSIENMLQEETNKMILKGNATPLVNDIINQLVLLETLFCIMFQWTEFTCKIHPANLAHASK